jgi:hypothetical protein
MILRNSAVCFIIFLLTGCGTGNKQTHVIDLNQGMATKLFNGQKNVMILSCTRCGCFLQALPAAYAKDKLFFDKVYLVTDTTCNSLKFIKNHISQQRMDSISDEIYNITLCKQLPGNREYITRIIETKENARILDICKDFFKE